MPLTAEDGADIINSVTGDDIRNGEIPGVFASRLVFSYIFTTGARKLVHGCHAPVFVRQGTAEMRHRAPTYRRRWVKNDGSGTLGFF